MTLYGPRSRSSRLLGLSDSVRLQNVCNSMPLRRLGVRKSLILWWALQDLNLQPTDYESAALTIELRAQTVYLV